METLMVLAGFLLTVWVGALIMARLTRPPPFAPFPGEKILRQTQDTWGRIFVDGPLAGGFQPMRTNRRRLNVVLSNRRLALTSWRGTLLEVARGEDHGKLACTGPRRLVVEGEREASADGRKVRIRVELAMADAEGWADDGAGVLSPPQD